MRWPDSSPHAEPPHPIDTTAQCQARLPPWVGWPPAQAGIPGARAQASVTTDNVFRYSGGVIASFRDKGTEDLFDGRDTKQARKACPSDLVRVARRKLDQLNQAAVLGDLRAPPSNRLEKLAGERGGQYSIRINDQWRVRFRWADSGAEDVEIVDYH
jgi:proteic killer suppression protein